MLRVSCPQVLHEGQHNDARTGTSIALTAALKGATIANHVQVVQILHGGAAGRTATGVKCKDNLTGKEFEIKAKSIGTLRPGRLTRTRASHTR